GCAARIPGQLWIMDLGRVTILAAREPGRPVLPAHGRLGTATRRQLRRFRDAGCADSGPGGIDFHRRHSTVWMGQDDYRQREPEGIAAGAAPGHLLGCTRLRGRGVDSLAGRLPALSPAEPVSEPTNPDFRGPVAIGSDANPNCDA